MFFDDEYTKTATFDYAEVKRTFLDTVEGRARHPQAVHMNSVLRWKTGANRDFTGCYLSEMIDWVKNGFHPEEMTGIEDYFEARPRRKIRFTDEGELDLSLALSGFDYPFMEWEKRDRKPGLKVTIELAFLASTKAPVIAAYGAWVAGVIASLEQQGYDLAVEIQMPSRKDVYQRAQKTACNLVVKRENEASDFTEWSALFSPGGFRMLGFTARAMACQEWGVKLASGYGSSLDRRWDILFNEEDRHLMITRPASPRDFPAEEMTAKLANVGLAVGATV